MIRKRVLGLLALCFLLAGAEQTTAQSPQTTWIRNLAPGDYENLKMSAQPGALFFTDYSGKLIQVSTSTNAVVASLQLSNSRINDLSQTPDGRFLIAALGARGVAIVEFTGGLLTSNAVKYVPMVGRLAGKVIASADLLSDGRRLAVTTRDPQGSLLFIDRYDGTFIADRGFLFANALVKNAPGKKFLMVSERNVSPSALYRVDYTDVSIGNFISSRGYSQFPAFTKELSFGRNAETVFVVGGSPYGIVQADTPLLDVKKVYSTSAYPNSVVASVGTRSVWSTSSNFFARTVYGFDTVTGRGMALPLQPLTSSPYPELGRIFEVSNYWTASTKGLALSNDERFAYVVVGQESGGTARGRQQIEVVPTGQSLTCNVPAVLPDGCVALRQICVPQDVSSYGTFVDWGFWSGTAYAGYSGLPAGVWKYRAPHWTICRQ